MRRESWWQMRLMRGHHLLSKTMFLSISQLPRAQFNFISGPTTSGDPAWLPAPPCTIWLCARTKNVNNSFPAHEANPGQSVHLHYLAQSSWITVIGDLLIGFSQAWSQSLKRNLRFSRRKKRWEGGKECWKSSKRVLATSVFTLIEF